MCKSFGWTPADKATIEKLSKKIRGEVLVRDKLWRKARKELRDAMVSQFNHSYGTDVNDINSWQLLCEVVGIEPIPQELKALFEK